MGAGGFAYGHLEVVACTAEQLLSSFGLGWGITIDRVPPSSDMARSPLQPFLVRATRIQPSGSPHLDASSVNNDVDGQVDDLDAIDTDETSQTEKYLQNRPNTQAAAVVLTFKPDPGAVNAEQIADVVQVSIHQHYLSEVANRHGVFVMQANPLHKVCHDLQAVQYPGLQCQTLQGHALRAYALQ